jgi:TetR/AcrR family transcriptional repressor of nem operon
MPQIKNKRDQILDAAEDMMRIAGYNGFSTREVAGAVSIKAASVHYHFPTKSDIGAAVAERYTQRFIEALGEPDAFMDPATALSFYIDAFRTALVRDGKLCLCAVLGAEIGDLPEAVGDSTRSFFAQNLAWLMRALTADGEKPTSAQSRATHVLASVEGAMILSKSLADDAVFERVAKHLPAAVVVS